MSIRLLIVDDEPDVAGMASLILSRAGYDVDTALSGADALARIDAASYALILLDINMPGMDGWEVLRILQADDRTASIPVAMFSVRGEVRDKVHGLQEGALDYITKPFGVDELPARVSTILDRHRPPVGGAS